MSKTQVHAVYSDEEEPFFEPPPHNGRDVRDVQTNRVQNGRYYAGKRAAAESSTPSQPAKSKK